MTLFDFECTFYSLVINEIKYLNITILSDINKTNLCIMLILGINGF